MEEEKESGVTFRDIVRMIGKRLWWVLGISIVIAAVAALLTAFVLNVGANTYSVAFMIEYPGGTSTYPDGTALRYESIIYSENLQKVKDGNEAYSGLDIAGMTSDTQKGSRSRSAPLKGKRLAKNFQIFQD